LTVHYERRGPSATLVVCQMQSAALNRIFINHFSVRCPSAARPVGDYGQHCELSFGPIFTKFGIQLSLNTPNEIFLGSPRNGRGHGHVTKFLIWSRGGRCAMLKRFEWPYLCNGSSDPLRVWCQDRVFGVSGSNGATSGWSKSEMTAGCHVEKIPMAISQQWFDHCIHFMFGSTVGLITPPPVGGRVLFRAISLFLCQQY